MCRHLAYLGPPVPLSQLLYEPSHALVRQTWAPRDMRSGGTINADGFGVGWYPCPGERPGTAGTATVLYRRDQPMWSDSDLPGLAAATRSGTVLAAARSATEGMPVTHTAVAPFTDGNWLFSHNGAIEGWPDSVSEVARQLPTRDLLTLPAPTDAALLWALVRARLRDGAGAVAAVSETVAEVARAAPGSRLNLLLVGARTAVASTFGHSLSWWADGKAVLISSEPLDEDPRWRPVAQRQLVVATGTAVQHGPLPGQFPPQPTRETL